ncbi:hypothetical protein KKF81_05320 [Candidatus Micrarchaeota archaeon]|nr:hypothetical protein [Candidatus Micrarchaeota archaeon]MBU1166347.1 hypothetical protein [Candidatus Micrarchaeota archaeon]MBU1886401.1 hypothetical protein [Candidatus Micrarchaeota archaeon]
MAGIGQIFIRANAGAQQIQKPNRQNDGPMKALAHQLKTGLENRNPLVVQKTERTIRKFMDDPNVLPEDKMDFVRAAMELKSEKMIGIFIEYLEKKPAGIKCGNFMKFQTVKALGWLSEGRIRTDLDAELQKTSVSMPEKTRGNLFEFIGEKRQEYKEYLQTQQPGQQPITIDNMRVPVSERIITTAPIRTYENRTTFRPNDHGFMTHHIAVRETEFKKGNFAVEDPTYMSDTISQRNYGTQQTLQQQPLNINLEADVTIEQGFTEKIAMRENVPPEITYLNIMMPMNCHDNKRQSAVPTTKLPTAKNSDECSDRPNNDCSTQTTRISVPENTERTSNQIVITRTKPILKNDNEYKPPPKTGGSASAIRKPPKKKKTRRYTTVKPILKDTLKLHEIEKRKKRKKAKTGKPKATEILSMTKKKTIAKKVNAKIIKKKRTKKRVQKVKRPMELQRSYKTKKDQRKKNILTKGLKNEKTVNKKARDRKETIAKTPEKKIRKDKSSEAKLHTTKKKKHQKNNAKQRRKKHNVVRAIIEKTNRKKRKKRGKEIRKNRR